jgi:ribulose-5-phosphate 4-epimerase/fuculose-1-phosphate aldolase
MNETMLREQLVKGCKILYNRGVASFAGHLSTRLSEGRILIKPRPVTWKSVTPGDLIIIDYTGGRVDGPASDGSDLMEWPIHTQLYQARPDVTWVLHAHPVQPTLMASLGIEVEPLTTECRGFAGRLPVYDNRDCLLEHNAMIVTPEYGDDMARTMGACRALILKYHGIVVAGESVGEVCMTAHNLEIAARTMLQAAAVRPLPVLDADQREALATARARHGARLGAVTRVEQWEKLQDYYLE